MGQGRGSDMGLEGVEICGSFLRLPAIQKSRSASMHSTCAPLVSAGISLPTPIPWFSLFFFFLSGWRFREKSKTEPLDELSERWDRVENTLTRSLGGFFFNSLYPKRLDIYCFLGIREEILFCFIVKVCFLQAAYSWATFLETPCASICLATGVFRPFTWCNY